MMRHDAMVMPLYGQNLGGQNVELVKREKMRRLFSGSQNGGAAVTTGDLLSLLNQFYEVVTQY